MKHNSWNQNSTVTFFGISSKVNIIEGNHLSLLWAIVGMHYNVQPRIAHIHDERWSIYAHLSMHGFVPVVCSMSLELAMFFDSRISLKQVVDSRISTGTSQSTEGRQPLIWQNIYIPIYITHICIYIALLFYRYWSISLGGPHGNLTLFHSLYIQI